MPLTLNNCKKHGGHVEEECPKCVVEEYNEARERSTTFFYQHGKDTIVLRSPDGKKDTITVEGLFQYFRFRMIHEMNEE